MAVGVFFQNGVVGSPQWAATAGKTFRGALNPPIPGIAEWWMMGEELSYRQLLALMGYCRLASSFQPSWCWLLLHHPEGLKTPRVTGGAGRHFRHDLGHQNMDLNVVAKISQDSSERRIRTVEWWGPLEYLFCPLPSHPTTGGSPTYCTFLLVSVGFSTLWVLPTAALFFCCRLETLWKQLVTVATTS